MNIGASVRMGAAATILLGSVMLTGCSSDGSPGSDAMVSSTASTVVPATGGTDVTGDGRVAPSGFRAVILTVTRPDGSTEQHCVWIAEDQASRARGLMGVTDPELGGRAGMVFRFPTEASVAFWMKDTPLPLSIAWFDASGSFVSSADMAPCPAGEKSCPTYRAGGPAQFAVEVPMGELAPLGLVERSRIALGERCS